MRKEKKRPKKRSLKRKIVFLLVLASTFIFPLFSSTYFALGRVEVKGGRQLSHLELLSLSKIRPRRNLFCLNLRKIRANLKKHPKIKEVDLSRRLPDTVLLEVRERKPEALVFAHNLFWIVDKEGFVLDKKDSKGRLHLPLLTGVGKLKIRIGERLRKEKISQALDCLKFSSCLQPEKLAKVGFDSLGKVYLYTKSGLEIRLGEAEDLKEKIEEIPLVLERIKEGSQRVKYIDIQVKDRPAAGLGEI